MDKPKLHKTIITTQYIHQSQFTTQSIKFHINHNMLQKYSTSQEYFYNKSIQHLVKSKNCLTLDKEGQSSCVCLNDIQFDDEIEHIQKFYKERESYQELPELLQYYKYYSQDSKCFFNKEFSFMAVYHEKKKAVLYDHLKKQLNISDSQIQIQEISKKRISQKYENVLSGLETTQNNDQSYLVNQMLKKLVNHYGPSRIKTIGKLDCQFKFMTHNFNMNKNKVQGKEGTSLFHPQTMLESTNTSVKNPYVKTKMSKNPTHRRFQSCQTPKSAYMKTKQKEKQKQKKINTQKIRRRNSTELISHFDTNTMLHSMQKYKKQRLKTEQQVKTLKQNNPHTNLKQKMQQIRLKIQKQKQTFIKKTQTNIYRNHKKQKK